jgi:hypothetical protein
MKRLMAWLIAIWLLPGLAGCGAGLAGEFAIYLATEDVSTIEAMATDLQHIPLETEPTIASKDIVSYSAEWHEMTLTEAAYDRLQALKVPVSGRPFVVCVGQERIYAGAFWTPISSLMFDGVTIWQPLGGDDEVARIEFGYPSSAYATGDDPRSDPRVTHALRQAGKLR